MLFWSQKHSDTIDICNRFVVENADRKKVLLVSHELTASGAPLMLLEAAKVCLEQECAVLLMSYGDGVLRKSFEDLGVRVVVSPDFRYNKRFLLRHAQGFDLAVPNTVVCFSAAAWLQKQMKVVWWIHEGLNLDMVYLKMLSRFKLRLKGLPSFCRILRQAKNILVVSEYAKGVVGKYNRNVSVIRLGEADNAPIARAFSGGKVKFALVGTMDVRKGQDILVEAVKQLSADYRRQAEFYFIGGQKGAYYESIRTAAQGLECIKWLDLITDQSEKWRVFNEMDVFLVPSTDESFGLMVLEGCMLSKPVVASENVGAKSMIKNGKNGYIVPTSDVGGLAAALRTLIDRKAEFSEMGKISRSIYEQNYMPDNFASDFRNLVLAALD